MTPPRLHIALACLALLGSAAVADVINVPGDYPTIQGAVDASFDGDVINIAAGTYNEHSLNPNGKAITIQGTLDNDGSLVTTIDAQQGGSVFVVDSGEDSGTVIKDLVITGGAAGWGGGGIFCDFSSNPTISDCTISGNIANLSGGGIYCTNISNPTITGCTISSNTAEWGGGIHCVGSNPTISTCVISHNTAAQHGGGIYCQYFSLPTITGCTISNNTASSGGGIYCRSGSLTITGCTISGNTSESAYGGGIYNYIGGNSILADTTVCGNDPDQIYGNWTDDGGNTIEDECPLCPGDATGDGYVDVNDVLYVISAWDTPDPNADFDGDGLVDADDVLILLSHYGESCL